MSVLSNSKATENETITFVNTQTREADFESLCTGAYFLSTADVHIAFDGPASTATFLIKANTYVLMEKVQFTRVSAYGDSGGGTLYILATRATN